MKKILLPFAFCLLTFAFPVQAAVTHLNSIATTGEGVTTLGVSHTFSGSEGMLLTSNHFYATGTVTDCDNDATPLSPLGASAGNDGNTQTEVWSLANPVSGTVTCNFSALTYVVLAVSNFNGAGSLGTATDGLTQTSFTTSSVDVTGATGGLVVDFITNSETANPMTADASQTVIIDNEVIPSDNLWAGASYKSGTGTLSMIWTWASSAYNAHVGVLINPVAAAAVTRRRAVVVQ